MSQVALRQFPLHRCLLCQLIKCEEAQGWGLLILEGSFLQRESL